MHSLFLSCGLLSRWSRYHPASVPGRMDVSMWSGCGGGGGGVSLKLLTVKLSQSETVPPSTGQRAAHTSPIQSSPDGSFQKGCVNVSEGWVGEGEEPRGVSFPPTSLLPLCWYTLDSNQYTHIQKGHCALNTNTSSLTSESFSKCHLAPEWQRQQRQLSSKEHLRRAATVSLPKLRLNVFDALSLDCNLLIRVTQNWEHLSIAMREKPTFTFCVGKSLEWKSRKTFQAEVCSGQN